ncbi:hypothetical protein GCM10023206_11260 [Acinetobacter puyangensis]|uniref:CS1 type fimbrial major subunit n=1 Tax=Acinetobacter puyangensis TaxID=1096779 RepID=A0A240EA35_9GAMM|nr:hypothetical protein [Acinetobacter puyangensis]SNX45564.1 hypothetical protein SAMN05421731_105118 [Acinetobacter puyangensis]
MRFFRTYIISLCFYFIFYSHVQAQPSVVATDQGDLKLIIVTSDSTDNIKKWFTTNNQDLILHRIFVIKPNQLTTTTFLVTGLSVDEKNHYHFIINVYVLNSNNEPIWGEMNYANGQGILANEKGIVIADPALDFMLDETDPIGTYTIVAQVTDVITGKKAESSYNLTLEKE